jgi:hypothetical protein
VRIDNIDVVSTSSASLCWHSYLTPSEPEKGTDTPAAGSQAASFDDLSPKDVVDTALGAEPAPDSSALEENTSQERLALVKGTYEHLIKLFPRSALRNNFSVVPHEETPGRTVISIGSPIILHTGNFFSPRITMVFTSMRRWIRATKV